VLTLVHSSREQLLGYLMRQLQNFFPDDEKDLREALDARLDPALDRLAHCIRAVRMWREDEFDLLHSSQYATFLYYLAHTLHRSGAPRSLCNKLFFLNKALNGIDLFYEIDLPPVFFIGHSVAIVLAKAQYGNHLALYQTCTVGKNHGIAPVLGDGVVLYPHSAVIGDCRIGDASVIAQGVSVVGRSAPGNCLVFQGDRGALRFARPKRDILGDIFRGLPERAAAVQSTRSSGTTVAKRPPQPRTACS
jgi:serine O-acetyltransferase